MPPQSLREFVQILIRARKTQGMTQAEVARILGVSRPAVNTWEQGTRIPTRANATAWAALFRLRLPDATIDWFNREEIAKVPVHGTRKGYQWHQRADEQACKPCLDAQAAWSRNYRRERAAALRD